MSAATAQVIQFPAPEFDDGDGGGGSDLAEFMLRLGLRLDEEDEATREKLRGIVMEILRVMATQEGA